MDPRIGSITVAHLLTHAGGWDEQATGQDAAMEPLAGLAAKALGVPAPPGSQVMIRYALGRPLDFDPGSKSVYSNLGYQVLGRIIEAISGQTYEQYVRQNVLEPLNIGRMRLARSLPGGRAPGEVRYYPESRGVASVFPHLHGLVPVAYGGLYLEGIDSSGGWMATPIHLVRFVTALDGSRAAALLKPGTLETMIRSPRPAPAGKWSYGLGWAVANEPGGTGWMKLGSTGGDCTYLRRRPDGLVVAASFNKRCDPGFDEEVTYAVEQVRDWPAHDLFPR
jgi:CubicO group peptidase (beta-lactamase class C family)